MSKILKMIIAKRQSPPPPHLALCSPLYSCCALMDDASAKLESVTDYHEEKTQVDASQTDAALANLAKDVNVAEEEAVDMTLVLSKEDIALIEAEMEVDKAEAERALRLNGGSVVEALGYLVRST